MDPRVSYIKNRLVTGFAIAKGTDVEKVLLDEQVGRAVKSFIDGVEGSLHTLTFTYMNNQLQLYKQVCAAQPVSLSRSETE
jgi:hypothetical protein